MVTKFSYLNNFNTLTGLLVSANSQMSQSSFTPSSAYRVLFNRTQTLHYLSFHHQLPPLHPQHHPVFQMYETTSLILGWPGSFTCLFIMQGMPLTSLLGSRQGYYPITKCHLLCEVFSDLTGYMPVLSHSGHTSNLASPSELLLCSVHHTPIWSLFFK